MLCISSSIFIVTLFTLEDDGIGKKRNRKYICMAFGPDLPSYSREKLL